MKTNNLCWFGGTTLQNVDPWDQPPKETGQYHLTWTRNPEAYQHAGMGLRIWQIMSTQRLTHADDKDKKKIFKELLEKMVTSTCSNCTTASLSFEFPDQSKLKIWGTSWEKHDNKVSNLRTKRLKKETKKSKL